MTTSQKSTRELYEHLLQVISSQRFLLKQSLGNEVPFFICPYPPSNHLEINKMRENLIKELQNKGIIILDVNLYKLCIDLLKERGTWGRLLQKETSLEKSRLKEMLINTLDSERYLIPQIARLMVEHNGYDVMFLSGVGEVYPYIRSHTILNNLQSTAKRQPTVLFFPGNYTHSPSAGTFLDLFGRLRDDQYYRAFNILDIDN